MRLIFLLALAACATSGVRELPRTDAFLRDWRAIEQCSGLTGDPNAVRLYQVPALEGRKRRLVAYYDSAAHAIYVTAPFVDHPVVWRHESLHALLRSSDHPIVYFTGRCALLTSIKR